MRRKAGGALVVTSGQLVGFPLAALVIIAIPGPGVLFVVGRALSHGRPCSTRRRYALAGGAGGLAMIGVGLTVAFTGRSK
jgi:threonine/homoserine/homoserine lactone efflux protein